MTQETMNANRFKLHGNLTKLSLIVALATSCLVGQSSAQVETFDTGGPMMAEQASYDVTFYDLAISVNPADSTITGSVRTVARASSPLPAFVLDLHDILDISSVVLTDAPDAPLSFSRDNGKVWIDLGSTAQPGDIIDVTVFYGGRPHIAENPPWGGGIQWERTADGSPWIATSCQGEGADIWWPVKDHVSDEPDSMGIHITVPDPLVAASNGRLLSVVPHTNGTSTYNWFVSTTINTYNVALNIAPYELIEDTFTSVAGDTFPIQFFVLPEDLEKGKAFFPEVLDHLRFYENLLGPYPFRADKYGVAQTPHLGMEHQTIIAYGAGFKNTSMTGEDNGFDSLHLHELAHEWWGNLVTNVNWNDMWIHEGFGSYMTPLYIEHLQGHEAYKESFARRNGGFRNTMAVAPREIKSEDEIYQGGDIYGKGSYILHTLRYLIGDEDMFTMLRRMTYPDPAMEQITNGDQTRFATTDDLLRLVNKLTDSDLAWYFDVYLRQPELPVLTIMRDGPEVRLEWLTPNGLPFPMPIDVEIDGELRRIEMPNGRAVIQAGENAEIGLDPDNWVLRERGTVNYRN